MKIDVKNEAGDVVGTFDPAQYLVQTRGNKQYLEVKWRLVWLRLVHPDAVIETEELAHDEAQGSAKFRAKVTIPGGGSATGHASETKSDFGDYYEKCETKALGRALAALGFGTQFVDDFVFDETAERVVDSPVENRRPVRQGQPAAAPQSSHAAPRQQSAVAQERQVGGAPQQPASQNGASTGNGATPAQVRALYLIGRDQHGLSEAQLEERVLAKYGCLPSELTKRQASEMITNLKR